MALLDRKARWLCMFFVPCAVSLLLHHHFDPSYHNGVAWDLNVRSAPRRKTHQDTGY